jgi:methyl-accepting chemotaxis protein
MTIPSAYQVGLGLYSIDAETLALRAEVWEILGPHLDAIMETHFTGVRTHAPFYSDMLTKQGGAYKGLALKYTERLFCNPYDEQWVEDCKARVKAELKLGHDMRSRSGVEMTILSEFNTLLRGRRGMLKGRAMRLMDVATRILMLDAATAVSLHYNYEFRGAKSRGDSLSEAIQQFRATTQGVREIADKVVVSLGDTSHELRRLADSASTETNKAAKAADDTVILAGEMATASGQLTASISEIHHQATSSAKISHAAVASAEQANASIHSLSEVVEKIGSVVGLISQIASQTNLLALNATIEAARAGEAGRGFAVVASEVKMLATQTSKATEEIAKQIAVIEEATRRSVGEIIGTTKTIAGIAAVAETVAAAVDEQAMATGSIASSASRTATNAEIVSQSLRAVEQTIQRTQGAAGSVLEFSKSLHGSTTEFEAALKALFQVATDQSGIKQFTDLSSASG